MKLAVILFAPSLLAVTADERVNSILAESIASDAPGCAVGVVQSGKFTYAVGRGMASLEHQAPITPSTAFYAGSLSKQFTAASILILAERGRVDLDAPVRKYVPELPEFKEGTPTVRHLLHHVSGLRESYTLLDLAGWRNGDDVSTEDDVMALVRRMKALNFAPGSQYMYSNTGYILLARIVKQVSGKPLREFAQAEIFSKAAMTNTRFRDDHYEVVPRLAMGYAGTGARGFRQAPAHVDTVGGGGLVTTVEDLAKWDVALSREFAVLYAELLRPFQLAGGKEIAYRRGLQNGEHRGLETVSHGGALAGYRSHYLRFPEQGLAVIALCNRPAEPQKIVTEIAESLLEPAMKDPGPERVVISDPPVRIAGRVDLKKFNGRYFSAELNAGFVIEPRDERSLMLLRPRNRKNAIYPIDDSTFSIEPLGVLQFDRTGFRFSGGGVVNLRFARQ